MTQLPHRFSIVSPTHDSVLYGEVVGGYWQARFIDADEMSREYVACQSLKKFADCYALTATTARSILKAHGIAFDDLLAEEWRAGASLRCLSDRHGPKPETLAKWLISHGCDVKMGNHKRGVNVENLIHLIKESGSVNRAAGEARIHWRTARRLSRE